MEEEEEARGTVMGYPIQHQPTATVVIAATAARNQPPNTVTTTTTITPSSQVFGVHSPRPTLRITKKSFYSLLMTLSVGFAVFIVLILPYLLTSAYRNPEFQPNHLFQKSANWEIIFDIRNPNSMISYSYDAIHVFIFSKDGEFLSGTTLPPFHQGKKNTTLLHASLAMPSSVVRRNMNSTEPASYTIRFESNLSAHPGDSALLMVFCDDVNIRLSLNTTAGTGTMKKCTERKIII